MQMLAYQTDGRHEQAAGPEAFVDRIERHPTIAAELVELSGLLQARSMLSAKAVPGLEDTPLCLHAAYGAREVLTAVGWLTAERRATMDVSDYTATSSCIGEARVDGPTTRTAARSTPGFTTTAM